MILDGQAYSESLDTALRLAAAAHAGQVRKGTLIPYLMHPVQVGMILERHGYEEGTVIAGILHDVLEDGKFGDAAWQRPLRTTFSKLAGAPRDYAGFREAVRDLIGDLFGAEVLKKVEAVTEVKQDGEGEKVSWRKRKKAQLAHVASMTADQIAVKAADASHNARSIARDVGASGLPALERFSCSPIETLWYYGSVSASVSDHLGRDHLLTGEVRAAVAALIDAVDPQIERSADTCAFCGRPEVTGCCGSRPSADREMRIFNAAGRAIYSLSHWEQLAPPRGKDKQWIDKRSAKEAARAWSQLDPPEDVLRVLRSVPELADFTVSTVYAEILTALDEFGEGRNHDLVLLGTAQGKRVLVGIEAKSDEELGPIIGEYRSRADADNERRKSEGTRLSRVPERIDGLVKRVFGTEPTNLVSLRYQLLHGLAGTLIEARQRGADVAVFLVHGFISDLTDARKVQRNEEDFGRFVAALGGGEMAGRGMWGPYAAGATATHGTTLRYFVGFVRTELTVK